MKILVAPLNWGLGHATRCIPLIRHWLEEGHEVVLGGDGDSLLLLRHTFPQLRYVELASLHLRYSSSKRQVGAMLCAMPKLILWATKDHYLLRAVLNTEPFDRVVSDNRFGLYAPQVECIYITHQLHIFLPKPWRWLEPLAERLHARIYTHYNKVWVPDYENHAQSLAGELSHPRQRVSTTEYIGPLSRFQSPISKGGKGIDSSFDTVAVLSGLEPQRTLLEQTLVERYQGRKDSVLIVQGLIGCPATRIKRGNLTIIPHLNDATLAGYLTQAKHIIARSGYSTIMDFQALGVLSKAELIPTPGQPEQEYLAHWLKRQ